MMIAIIIRTKCLAKLLSLYPLLLHFFLSMTTYSGVWNVIMAHQLIVRLEREVWMAVVLLMQTLLFMLVLLYLLASVLQPLESLLLQVLVSLKIPLTGNEQILIIKQ